MSVTILKNNTETVVNIPDLGLTIPPGETVNILEMSSDIELAQSNDMIDLISSGDVIINDGLHDLQKAEAIRYITGHTIASVTDQSGKMRVHQTSRKLGLRINWAGLGDSQDDIDDIGGGESYAMIHDLGEADPEHKYIDYNMCNNETWLHEGYVTWKDCHMDTLTLEMVSRVTAVAPAENTNYSLYGGYMVIPAAGDGTIELTEDISHPNNGLIYMPDGDLGEKPTAFWNADYNSSTKLYENITPAPYGNGRYNMFAVEIVFARFLNSMPLLGSGFMSLDSSDTDQMGHGMRLKMKAVTCKDVEDHVWAVACLMCLHRQKSV